MIEHDGDTTMLTNDPPKEPAIRKMERRIHNSKLRDLFREHDKQATKAQEQPPGPVVSIIENTDKRTKPTEGEKRSKAILRHIRMLIRADVAEAKSKRRLLLLGQLQRAKNELARRDPKYMKTLLLREKLRRLEARRCR
jgi:hypothetical protein